MSSKTLNRSAKEELRDRVEAYKKRLEARILELKADSSETSRSMIRELEGRLQEVKKQASDGWDNLTEDVAARLNALMKKAS